MTTLFLDDTRTHIELTGTDRAKFLHNFCTNDILKLKPGQGCEAFVCNVKGRVIGHITVFVGETSLWLESVAGAAATLIAHLDRYLIRENVTITDRSGDVIEILLVGPQAAATIAKIFGEGVIAADAPLYQSQLRPVDGTVIRITRIDRLGDPTWFLIVPKTNANALIEQFQSNGAVRGSVEQAESLRIAAGFPEYGRDITEDHLAQEVGRTARCISFTKGCYLGQEPIARLDALGHTNRELRRLKSTSAGLTAGMTLRDAENTQDIGVITSAAHAPEGHGNVALGYLKSRWLSAGTTVTAVTENGTIAAQVL